jgi:hypothetical protein
LTKNPPNISSADDNFAAALASFWDAPPGLLERRVLQRRIDRKFVFHATMLEPLLADLSAHFSLVRSATASLATYHTVYCDTPERLMYENHRRGRLPRHKVRVRHHLERQLSFVEVKCKTADARTTKARMPQPFGEVSLDGEAEAFLAGYCPVPPDLLAPQLSMAFRRITLVGNDVDERVTIDVDLEVSADTAPRRLPGVAVAEIKQSCYGNDTPSIRVLRALHVRERSFSKYCIGTALLAPVRSHAFRHTLRFVDRLCV